MSERRSAENDAGGYVAAAWMRDDGTGYYFTCPRCHFYKNATEGPCRMVGCGGTVERVEVRIIPPGDIPTGFVDGDARLDEIEADLTRDIPPEVGDA